MFKTTLIQMRATFRRTLAVVIAVVLSVAFVAASIMSGSVVTDGIRESVGNQLRGSDIIISSDYSSVDPSVADMARNIEGVRTTELLLTNYGQATLGGANILLRFGPLSELPELVAEMPIEEGRLPDSDDEIMLTEGAASGAGVDIGDVFVWQPLSSSGSGTGMVGQEFTVVGLIAGGNVFGSNITEAVVTPGTFHSMVESPTVSGIIVQVEEGADIETVRLAIAEELAGVDGTAMTAMTFDQQVDQEVRFLSQGTNQIVYALVTFALITMFSAGVVITNTFSITIAQRTREIALIRSIGAGVNQMRWSLVQEALMLGVVSSVLGVVVGYVLVNAASALFITDGFISVSLWAVIVPLLLGIGVTLFASLGPTRSAMAVRPLQALRQADVTTESDQGGFSRLALSIVMTLGGVVLLVGAAVMSLMMETGTGPEIPLVIGMVGGALSFLGLLTGSVFLVPALVSLLGTVTGRLVGMPGKIASATMQRNPRRTASTAGALMIGVTLITMMTVGAATVQATWTDVVNTQAPVDLDVRVSDTTSDDVPMPDEMLSYLGSVDGVTRVVPIQESTVALTTSDEGGDPEIPVVAIHPDQARTVSRSGDVFGTFEPGTVLVPGSMAAGFNLKDGDQARLSNGYQFVDLSVQLVDMSNWEIYVTPQDLSALDQEVVLSGAWLRIDDGSDVKDIVDVIPNGMPQGQSVDIQGSAHDRETYMELVDQILLVVTGLLAVAVMIAFVGVGNTLTLSVLERTRESGMLRALGLTVRQLHATLAIEGALISLVAGLIGVIVGAFYGWMGALTLFASSWDISLGYPVGRIVIVLVVAVLAGLLASVLPARRATSISPVEALAAV